MSVEFEVFHDGRFWVGVLTVRQDAGVRACQVVFGAEPSDPDLYAYLLRNGYRLLERAEANPLVPGGTQAGGARSPKRAARQAAVQARRTGTSTAAQEAVRLAQEVSGKEREKDRRRSLDGLADRKRQLRQARAKQKHRGR